MADATGAPAVRFVVLQEARDAEAVTTLSHACADYAMLVGGEPPRDDDGPQFFRDHPAGLDRAAMLKLGLRDHADRLLGVADVARGYPVADAWYIGLLLLAPDCRGRGLGGATVQRIDALAAGAGAQRLMLSVVEANRSALMFWRRLGFAARRKLPPTRFGTLEHARIEFERPVGHVSVAALLAGCADGKGRLTAFPANSAKRAAALDYLLGQFGERTYTEREVNDLLLRFHTFDDPARLRRELFDTGRLRRTRDGRSYWRADRAGPPP